METTLIPLLAASRAVSSSSAGVASRVANQGLRAEEFEQLVREHQRRIYRVLLALVRDPDTADTLTQECFLRAYRKRASFRGESSPGTWLVRIAINLARDHGRNRRNAFWSHILRWRDTEADAEAGPLSSMADTQPSPERVLAAREQLDAVWSAVEELSPQQRAIFLFRFVEEMTLEEIAEATGRRAGTVKSHLFRAVGAVRERLRKQMEFPVQETKRRTSHE